MEWIFCEIMNRLNYKSWRANVISISKVNIIFQMVLFFFRLETCGILFWRKGFSLMLKPKGVPWDPISLLTPRLCTSWVKCWDFNADSRVTESMLVWNGLYICQIG